MKKFFENTDIVLAFGIILILGLMIIPLPPFMLDFLLAINISLAILVLIVSIYIKKALDISIFPGLLLVLTLFRLSLNISSTRLILLEGYAGSIIETFGAFVVGGSYVVGFIIFFILVIIQFVVIVKGSGRISEVAARFTLDAMPGKQMAIDADLNSGLINEAEARERRDTIRQEAEFYGSMDGASKFVKGDAIAGIIITTINILGGFVIGVAQLGMSFQDAIQSYTILTIGDGLVSQIPALLISVSAGMVVTKNAEGNAMDKQMRLQLLGNPRVMGVVAGSIMMFAIIPGMPTIPFLFLGTVAGVSTFFLSKKKKEELVIEQEIDENVETEPKEEKVEEFLQVDPIEIEIGYGLISLVDENLGGNLFQKIASTRKFIALEYGVLVPPVRVRDNLQLNPNEYIIKIKGNIVSKFEVYSDRYMAMNPGVVDEDVPGIPTRDPAFGLDAYWINENEKEKAELLGYTVVDAISVLSTHLQETIKKNFEKILTRQSTKQLLENLKKDYPAVIEDIDPNILPLGTIQKVLQNLLREQLPIKDLVQVLESLIDYSKVTKNVDVLTEYVRHSLSDTIANMYMDQNGIIRAITIGEQLESRITQALSNSSENSNSLGLSPDALHKLNLEIDAKMQKFREFGYLPIFATSATIRPYFYRLINSSFPEAIVLSYTELPADVEIEFLGKLEI